MAPLSQATSAKKKQLPYVRTVHTPISFERINIRLFVRSLGLFGGIAVYVVKKFEPAVGSITQPITLSR